MCGIFGVIVKDKSSYDKKLLRDVFTKVGCLSEVRGKDSSGIAIRDKKLSCINVVKGPIPIKQLLKSPVVKSKINETLYSNNHNFSAIGHARLTTNGSQLIEINNQPVVKNGVVGIHNGIIVNSNDLWREYSNLKRHYEIDTEIMLDIFKFNLDKNNNLIESIRKTNQKLFGTVATALFVDDSDEFVLFTNNGSLYILTNDEDILVFASERNILAKLNKKLNLSRQISNLNILQVKSNTGYTVSYSKLKFNFFDLENKVKKEECVRNPKLNIEITSIQADRKSRHVVVEIEQFQNNPRLKNEISLLENNFEKIHYLRRCSKCILPETFPFIEYDEHGVCNYCRNYQSKNLSKSINEFVELVEPYKSPKGQPDVLIPFSGGRDSTYTLHLVKRKLGLNPVAYTYDWGMVTDLARRNIARVCGKLGVENIIVAANIHWKRENIKKNIIAWLAKPHLGMVPLFMAGDKFFFYYANKVKKENNIRLNIWGINYLENTDFKTGFAGLAPQFQKKNIYSLSISNQMKLFGFVGRRVLESPGYLNQSLLDNLGSFASRYIFSKKDYYNMFDYYKWDEEEIESLVLDEYNWEKAIDTNSTWRIGDGTAGFYNYIYTTVAGFCENDTFRSNQIRENMMTRENALKLIEEENQPRFASIKWYLDILGLNFTSTINTINKIPKLYASAV
jgi:hypothetical protein